MFDDFLSNFYFHLKNQIMENIAQEKTTNAKVSKKKKMIRVDMTPMVDLGFLLITFFMFTTNFDKPSVMDLGLPADGPEHGNVIDYNNQITFILGKQDRIFYYQQERDKLKTSDLKETSFAGTEIAKLIEERKSVAPKPEIFTVIVKPTEDSNYKNFVDVLDEIAISKNERYGITDLVKNEKDLYKEITN